MTETAARPPRKSVIGRPRPGQYLTAGVLGGFLSGVGFIALWSWFALSNGASQMSPFRVIASIIQGPAAAQGGGDLWLGMLVHAVLSALFGLIFALLTVVIRSASFVAFAGLVYGAAIYVVDFQVLARIVPRFSAFRDPFINQPFEASIHLVYGALLAALLLWGARRDAGLKDARPRGHRRVDETAAPGA